MKKYQCFVVRIENGAMPKSTSCANDQSCFTAEQMTTLKAWVDAGGPESD